MLLRKCKLCNKDFRFRACPSDIASGRGNYCSRICNIQSRATVPKEFVCLICDKIFPKINGHHRKFCSHGCYAKSLIGKKATGQQIEALKKGRVYWSGKVNPSVVGVKNVNWKGGVTPLNEKLRKSLKYKKWRNAVFRRDDWTCVLCGDRGHKINADHMKPFALYPRLRFSLSNGRTLCVACHRKTNTYGKNITKRNYIKTLTATT